MNDLVSWTRAPVLVLAAWALAEALRVGICRRCEESTVQHTWSRVGVFALRPWAVWAVFNLVVRWRAAYGFNNPRTFPLYANLWTRNESIVSTLSALLTSSEVWLWSAIVVCLTGVAIASGRSIVVAAALPARRAAVLLGLLCLLAFGLWTAIACLPGGFRARGPREPGSYLQVWYTAGGTFLYNMPHIRSTDHFLRHFEALQPQLRHTIHGVTHPPGAALSLYWIGELAGADADRIRERDTKLRYAFGLTAAAALNVLAVFGLGAAVFGSVPVGLIAALLWLCSPAATAYATFSQDVVYALFFHLALAGIWGTVRWGRHRFIAIALGIVFAALVFLTFSWCLATTMFALFALWSAWRERWSVSEIVTRGILPLAVMTVLAGGMLWMYRLDYLAIYDFAHAYHREWYRFTGAYQWIIALIGGQLELVLMAGSMVSAVVLRRLAGWWTRPVFSPQVMFVLVVFGVYALPILFGPNPLKMETSRCWMWMLALPITAAADAILRARRPAAWLTGAVITSILSSYLLRLFINFGS